MPGAEGVARLFADGWLTPVPFGPRVSIIYAKRCLAITPSAIAHPRHGLRRANQLPTDVPTGNGQLAGAFFVRGVSWWSLCAWLIPIQRYRVLRGRAAGQPLLNGRAQGPAPTPTTAPNRRRRSPGPAGAHRPNSSACGCGPRPGRPVSPPRRALRPSSPTSRSR